MSDILRKKLDARGRRQLAEGTHTGAVEALIRTEAPVTPEQELALRRAGAEIRSVAGDVLSAWIADIARLEEIASLTFVRKIELSRPLYQEGSSTHEGEP
jgi:hypothetical protein